MTTTENTSYVFAASDFGLTEPSGSTATLNAVEITTLPTVGTVTDNNVDVTVGQFVSASDINNGLLAFVPALNGTGTPYDSFTFQVQDNGGTVSDRVDTDPNPKTMTVNVSNYVNLAPSGTTNTVTVAANTPYTFTIVDLGYNDPNTPTSDLLAVEATTVPGVGSLLDNGVSVTAGQIINASDFSSDFVTYTPPTNASGNSLASFAFQVENSGGTANGGTNLDPTPKTMSIDVTQAETYGDVDNTLLSEGSTESNNLFSEATNFNSSALAISTVNGSNGNVGAAITTTAGGTLTVNADGSFSYSPPTNYTGADSFTYTDTDGTLIGDGTATINIAGITLDPPSYTTPYNQILSIPTGGLFQYTNEPTSTSLTVAEVNGGSGNVGTSITTTAGGSVTVNANGSFNYTPPSSYTASDSFTVTVSDGCTTATATVSITLTDASASDAIFSTPHDTTLTIASSLGLLTYSSDADNNPLTVSEINGDSGNVATATTTVGGGTVTVQSDGSFVYVPASGFIGVDFFTYTVSDGSTTSTANVVINVTDVVTTNATYTTPWNQTLTVGSTTGLVTYASDPDSDTITITAINGNTGAIGNAITTAEGGTLTVAADGSFTYVAAPEFIGDDFFTYTASNGISSSTSTVDITVTQGLATITLSNPADITYGTALDGTQLNATADVAGTFSYSPASGTVLNAGSGQTLTVIFTPTDTTDYTTATQSVTINVTPASLTVTASDVTMTYADGTTLNESSGFTTSGLQGSDAIDSLTLVTNVTLSGSSNWNAGSWTITPSAATGTEFNASNYTITYNTGNLTVNQATLTISGVSGTDKIYDGTTTDTISGTAVLSGAIAGDDVTLDGSSASASFGDASVGTGKTVTFSGYTITGTDSGNYTLSQPGNSTASITPASTTTTALFTPGYIGNTVTVTVASTTGMAAGMSYVQIVGPVIDYANWDIFGHIVSVTDATNFVYSVDLIVSGSGDGSTTVQIGSVVYI